jgi:hypothetical protein
MGKSKYQAKLQKKIAEEPRLDPTSAPKYYDEDVVPRSSSNSQTKGFAIFLIVTFCIAGGIAGGIIYAENNPSETTTNTPGGNTSTPSITTTTTTTAVLKVANGRSFTVYYTLWKDTNGDGVADTRVPQPGEDADGVANFPVDGLSKSGLIAGFYYNLLGMTEGQEKTFDLPANVDANGDGIDDNTGQEVLSYGNPTHEMFNTALRFWVRVVNIR